MFDRLPLEVTEYILELLDQQDLAQLSKTCRLLREIVNSGLYKRIVVADTNDKIEGHTIVKIDQLDKFVEGLSEENFLKVQSFLIYAQSNLVNNDYFPLYRKLAKLWEIRNHQVYFVNFDIQNIRNARSLNQFVVSNYLTYIENEEEEEACNDISEKVCNLKNWIIFNLAELNDMPHNPNLQELDMLVEYRRPMESHVILNRKAVKNLENLSSLFLDSPLSTLEFCHSLGSLRLKKIKRLSITTSHTFKEESKINFDTLNRVVDLSHVEEFELKINCTNEGCHCLHQFFTEWINSNHSSPLDFKKFALVNYHALMSKTNLLQFREFVYDILFLGFLRAENIILSLNDFTELNTGFSVQDLLHSVDRLHVKSLFIPDFFYSWFSTVPKIFKGKDSLVDNLVNGCDCNECNFARRNLSKQLTGNEESVIPSTRVIQHKLGLMIYDFKKQMLHLNQTLNSISSFLSWDRTCTEHSDLKLLVTHSCVDPVSRKLFEASSTLQKINLGGVSTHL